VGGGPTYLICVGAAKAGTSWLFDHLEGHPDCFLRSVKELHYFDPPESGLSRMQARSNTSEIARLTARLSSVGADQAVRIRRRVADMTAWNAVLDLGPDDLDAYRGYLTEGLQGQRVVADVTPSYSLLPPEDLARLAGVAPDVRILYLMRDPVARLWSHIRMLAAREARPGLEMAEMAASRMDRALAGDDLYCGGRGDYRGCLERLRAAIDPRRLLVMFTEDLMTRPGLVRLWDFLGIGPGPADLENRVHEGVALPLMPVHRDRARVALREQYAYVAQAFPTLPSAWSANMIGSVS
jgi:hypothetical protein